MGVAEPQRAYDRATRRRNTLNAQHHRDDPQFSASSDTHLRHQAGLEDRGLRRGGRRLALVGDKWEEQLRDIPRYLSDYATEPLVWRDEETGETVELARFVEQHDA